MDFDGKYSHLHGKDQIESPADERHLSGIRGMMPSRFATKRQNYLLKLNCFTITFVASPSTVTTATPAGAAIVTLSEAAT